MPLGIVLKFRPGHAPRESLQVLGTRHPMDPTLVARPWVSSVAGKVAPDQNMERCTEMPAIKP